MWTSSRHLSIWRKKSCPCLLYPSYHRTDYIPCILWGRSAQEAASALPGSKLHVTGRLQSRDYIKVIDGESFTRTAYELSVTEAEFLSDVDFSE